MALIPVTSLYADAVRANALYNESARQQAAYNALRRQYGDIAGDPQAARQMQQYAYDQQANPLRLEDLRIQNALSQQTFDFNEAYNPIRIESAELANREARVGVTADEADMRRKAFVDGALYVKRRMSEGADVGAAFDEIAPHLPGSDEEKAAIRRTLVENPGELDAFLETFMRSDGDVETGLNPIYGVDAEGNTVLLQTTKDGRVVQSQMPAGVTVGKDPIRMDAGDRIILLDPVTRQQIGVVEKGGAPSADQSPANRGIIRPGIPGLRGPLDAEGRPTGEAPIDQGPQLRPTPGSKLDREMQAEAAAAEERRLSQEAMAGAVAAPVLRTLNRSLDNYVPNFVQGDSVLSSSMRLARQYIPGTAEHQFVTEIITPLSNVSLERLQQMRQASATGASGLGQVTQSEHEMLQNSLGAIDVTLPPETLRENLRQLHNTFLDIIYGSRAEREALVRSGRLDAAVNADIEKQYYPTEYDQFGRRRSEAGGDGGLSDLSDEELMRRVFGGE